MRLCYPCNSQKVCNLFFFFFRNHAISPINQLLCTLRYYATGSTLLAAGDFSGFSAATAHRIVHRVSAAIAHLRPTHIQFPGTADEIKAAQLGFYRQARFPRAVGAMDCTHVKNSITRWTTSRNLQV